MEEKDIIILTETTQRSKSNTRQIDDIKEEIKEIKENQKAIYELTTSVKLIAQDMSSIKESVNKVEQGQNYLSDKMEQQISDVKNQIECVDKKSKIDFLDYFKQKILPWIFAGGGFVTILKIVEMLSNN